MKSPIFPLSLIVVAFAAAVSVSAASADAEERPDAPPRAERLTEADRAALAEALRTIQRVEAKAMADIHDELKAVYPGLSIKRGRGGFIKNDYRAYQWIEVSIDNREYWITTVYNDLDFNSGNFHSQYGRIQFWKNIRKIGHVSTPNDKIEGWWRPRMDHQWRSLPPTFVWSDDFSARRVVELFGQFLAECGETLPQADAPSPEDDAETDASSSEEAEPATLP